MRKFFIAICIISVFFLGGCSKKQTEKTKVTYDMSQETKGLAENEIIPLYNDDEQVFDFEDADIKDFALIDDTPVAEESETVAKGDKVSPYDEWIDEEDELALAWADGQNDAYEFRVVQFDLNKNEIRADQKESVAQNVQIANKAVGEGKKVVVAGHCCPLGSPSFNMSLSEKRAKAIRDEMVRGGVPSKQVKILGCGSEFPVVSSESQDREKKIQELAPNRRAEVSVD